MVRVCWIKNCSNRSDKGETRTWHSVPTVRYHEGEETCKLSDERRRKWLANIGRKQLPTKYSTVCSDHFVTGKPSYLHDISHPDWAPTLKLGLSAETSPTSTKKEMQRYVRAKDRKEKKDSHEAARSLLQLASVTPPHCQTPSHDEILLEEAVNSENMTDELQSLEALESECEENSDKNLMHRFRDEVQALTSENMILKENIRSLTITEESFADKDDKVSFNSGLPTYVTLMSIFNFLKPYISATGKSSLTKFQQLILVLMRLRLNLSVQDLAYRFDTSTSTVSRTFQSVIHVMYCRMKSFILWPDREELRLTMPLEFRKRFGLKVAIIIDCFEIFIERPSNLMARAQTWSQYKHHNTVKFLIGITPQGAVSFLSKGYGGRASDKYITEDCGFLLKLLPGDVVLADRGFDIADSVGLMCAEVKIPSFLNGKSQLSAFDVESTRNIAHVRIHVERVIGLVRNKYTILQGTLPIDFLISDEDSVPIVDKITTVCCALSNFCDSVVPFD